MMSWYLQAATQTMREVLPLKHVVIATEENRIRAEKPRFAKRSDRLSTRRIQRDKKFVIFHGECLNIPCNDEARLVLCQLLAL